MEIKLSNKIFKNFNMSVRDNVTSTMPPLGMGFVYRAVVHRAGLRDGHYIGLTSRPLSERKKEHIQAAKSLGVLNPDRVANGEKFLSYNTKSKLYPIMRTAMGTRQTRADRVNNPAYFSMAELGRVSLHALPIVESMLIEQDQRDGGFENPMTKNYDSLRHVNNLNVGKGGEGMHMNQFAISERVVSSYIYLKHESAERINTIEDLVKRINELSYRTGKTLKNQSNILYYLEMYLNFADTIQASLQGNKFHTLVAVKRQVDSIMRPRGVAKIGGISGDMYRMELEKLKDFKIDRNGLWDHFNNTKQVGMKNEDLIIDVAAEAIIKRVADDAYNAIVAALNDKKK